MHKESHAHLSDAELYRLCCEYGEKALAWRRKFIGLLPEVSRRKLYEKKGCRSIFEFAAKLAGVSEGQVREALNLERRFQPMPTLHQALVSGAVSVSKLARVASIATPENEAALAEQARILSTASLNTLARDERCARSEIENDFNEPRINQKSLCVQTSTLHLNDDVKRELEELQGKGIDVSDLLRGFLAERKRRIAEEKECLAEEEGDAAVVRVQVEERPKRHIPAAIKRVIAKEHGTKCAAPYCKRPSKTLHHTARFSLTGSHNPHYLAPLCKEHHQIAHTIDAKYHEKRAAGLRGGARLL